MSIRDGLNRKHLLRTARQFSETFGFVMRHEDHGALFELSPHGRMAYQFPTLLN